MTQVTIRSFTDLNVWKESHKLVLMIYNITSTFPSKETYSLTDQIRRAVASVTAFNDLAEQANISHQLLQGFIQKTKTFINHKS